MSKELPLNVRCAMALGWRAWLEKRGEYELALTQASGTREPWHSHQDAERQRKRYREVTLAEAESVGYFSRGLPPYGADTPDGWACTGPLIARFGLTIGEAAFHSAGHHVRGDEPTVYYAASILAGGSNAQASTPCAAVAEWVAQFGVEAIKYEKEKA